MTEPAIPFYAWAALIAERPLTSKYDTAIGRSPEQMAYIIATNNDALPDDDERKITAATVTRLRAARESCTDPEAKRFLWDLADALEAWIPPA